MTQVDLSSWPLFRTPYRTSHNKQAEQGPREADVSMEELAAGVGSTDSEVPDWCHCYRRGSIQFNPSTNRLQPLVLETQEALESTRLEPSNPDTIAYIQYAIDIGLRNGLRTEIKAATSDTQT